MFQYGEVLHRSAKYLNRYVLRKCNLRHVHSLFKANHVLSICSLVRRFCIKAAHPATRIAPPPFTPRSLYVELGEVFVFKAPSR